MKLDGFRDRSRFLGLTEAESSYENSDYVILPVPYDGTASFTGGSREGPHAIIDASIQMEYYDAEYEFDASQKTVIHTLPELEPDYSSPEKMVELIENVCRTLLQEKKFPITLGGEHTVSLGAIRALYEQGKKFSVLQIDAHSDLRHEYEGTIYSHACVMRRVHDLGIPFVQVGIRAVSEVEHQFIKEENLSTEFYQWNLDSNGFNPELMVKELTEDVYITIDVDGFDPSVFPGTGTPEPGGLSWQQGIALLKEVVKHKNIIGFDVVETIPTPAFHVSEFTAARLVYKIITLLEAKKL
jgi:agmatinase